MKRINRRFSNISSLHELQLERSKLELQLEHKERELANHWEDTKEMLTFGSIMESVFGNFSFSSIISVLHSGGGFLSRLFGHKKKKRCCRK